MAFGYITAAGGGLRFLMPCITRGKTTAKIIEAMQLTIRGGSGGTINLTVPVTATAIIHDNGVRISHEFGSSLGLGNNVSVAIISGGAGKVSLT